MTGVRRSVWARLALVGCCCAQLGCGTLLGDRNQLIAVTSNPSGAKVTDQGSGETFTTPGQIELHRKKAPTLIVSKEGYREKAVYLRREPVITWLLLDGLLTLWVGALVDANTGALYELDPAHVYVVLEPAGSGGEEPR